MKKLFGTNRTVTMTQELQNAQTITKERLQALLCELPARKRTVLLINDFLHEDHLPIEDVGLALGIVAARVIIAERGERMEFTKEGREMFIEESRILFLEGVRPFFEDNLGHLLTVVTTFIGSVLGGTLMHLPLSLVLEQLWSSLALTGGTILAGFVPLTGYTICLVCGRLLGSKSAG